jgi:hypothetical protein
VPSLPPAAPSSQPPTSTHRDELAVRAMSSADGCPECVLNVEPPRSYVPTDNGYRTAHLCASCGHAWTTDWMEN